MAAYLVANPQSGTYSNTNVAAYLVANPQSGTYSNTNVATYLPTYTGNIAGNIVKNGYAWTFGTDSTTTFPSNISIDYSGNNVQFPRIIATSGKAVSLQGQGNIGSAALAWTVNPDAASQYAAVSVSRSGGDNLAKVILQAQSDSGDAATAKTWQFNETGTTRFPGDIILAPAGTSITMQSDQYSQLMWENANLTVAPNMAINSNFYVAQNNATLDIGYRDGNSTQLIKTWLWSVDGTLTLPTAGRINFDYLSISSDANVSAFYAPSGNVQLAAGIGNAQIVANSLNDSKTWNFGTDGNLALPTGGVLLVSGGITAGPTISSPAPYLSGFSSISAQNFSATGNITGGNILSNNYLYANGINILSGISGNYANANVATYLASNSNIVITTTGNIRGNYLFGNGSQLTSVVTRFESSWTVPTGNSTQSFTVGANETYYMWVDCNIPNGILVWNATASITNTNVPVVGAQYAWVYSGGGTPIDFTSIPNQFVGTANTIVRSSVAPSATTNRFDFGINNTSGGNVTVRYGWIQIS